MQATRMMMGVLLAGVMALGGTACSKGKKEVAAETQVSGDVRTPNAPMTVTGCLRAGEASDTYVLTQDASATGTADTANYQLVGVSGVNLRDHIGERVQVSGVLASQQEVASRSAPSQQEKATGTTGTPTVQTQTQVDIRTLQVNSVNPQGGKCDTK